MKYIDIHCHLDFPDYGAGIGAVLERMREGEVGAITIGTDLESSRRVVEIANNNSNVWACVGVHPRESGNFDFLEFEKLISEPKVVAVGECGLDWFKIPKEELELERSRQEDLFKNQIDLAIKFNKPLMLHCRESYNEVLSILEKYKDNLPDTKKNRLRGNAHFFVGNIEQAKRFLALGFTMSFTGVITFTHDYDEVIKFIPIESIMSETDAPFVAPVPHRGQINEPSFVKYIVQKISLIKEIDEDLVLKTMFLNAKNSFNLNI